ncbi:MAG: TetR/AcrR family transcriptional regulator [Burkholderiaceae bacterium]|nr:TetR/AcrR family transcriptional regulator [Burkholderiaceae bacterium]
MVSKRLSREDSRGRTAQRLLDGAERLIAKKGFEATSIKDVTEAAGYSRGAFYSNFRSKSELFLELLRRDQERASARLEAAVDDSLPLVQLGARMREVYAALYLEGASFLTWTEARMLAARDAKFRDKLDQLIAEKRDQAVTLLEYFYKRAGRRPAGPLEPLAMGFISLMEGVRLIGVSCPDEMPPPVAQTVLRLFSSAVMRQVRQAG